LVGDHSSPDFSQNPEYRNLIYSVEQIADQFISDYAKDKSPEPDDNGISQPSSSSDDSFDPEYVFSCAKVRANGVKPL
jgi:hypothetical protein